VPVFNLSDQLTGQCKADAVHVAGQHREQVLLDAAWPDAVDQRAMLQNHAAAARVQHAPGRHMLAPIDEVRGMHVLAQHQALRGTRLQLVEHLQQTAQIGRRERNLVRTLM